MIYNFSRVTPNGLALDRYARNYFVNLITSALPGMVGSAVRVISLNLLRILTRFQLVLLNTSA